MLFTNICLKNEGYKTFRNMLKCIEYMFKWQDPLRHEINKLP